MQRKIIRVLATVGLSLLFALSLHGTALAQEVQVSGRVTGTVGEPLAGVTVLVRGTSTQTTTDANGRYSLTAPGDGVLLFNLIGYKGAARTIGGRASIDVAMDAAVAVLDPVIVTGYTAQRRADITGAVSSVGNMETVAQQTGTSVLQRLDGRVPGVQVENSGSPGSRTTVRIRGVSSFQNNDPLYIIDGTPVQDSYLNWLNPSEVASIQVLKDASAASIYGARANNGVIIVETKKGRPGQPQFTLDVRTGVATPVKGYDDILELNSLKYHDYLRASYENIGLPVPSNIYGNPNSPSVPAYTWPNCPPSPCTGVDTSAYSFPDNLIMPGSSGTNWWNAVFGAGQYRDANLALSGGGDDNAYHVSFNYLDQEGTAAYNRVRRGGARVNTTFNVGRVRVGENIAVSREQRYGGIDDGDIGENNIIGKNIFMQPVVPVYDIAGNFASGKATSLGNNSNPLKIAWNGRHNITTNDRIFGSVFAGVDATRSVSLTTRFGFNLGQNSFHGFAPATPEDREPTLFNAINENYNLFTEWTWSNTLNYTRAFDRHNLTVLVGQEANAGNSRFEAASCSDLTLTNPDSRYIQDALCDPTTKNVFSEGVKSTLLSFFGKADYNFGEKYYLSLTVRRDGSSRISEAHRWATFPAIGLGWKLSRESFLANSGTFSNLMLRFGWGVTGNQQIPPGRIFSVFGGDRGDTFYDISGSGSLIQTGYKITRIGNPDLKWEEQQSLNVGLDAEFLNARANLTVDVYQRNTNNLLFDPRLPATAGSAAAPILNIGKMRNTGFDLSLGYRGTIGAGTMWSATLNGSHYKNEIRQIDNLGNTFFFGPPEADVREQNAVINQIGHPIGAFYGLVADGYYVDSADAARHFSSGARPGRIRFVDQPTVLDTIACPAAPGCVGLYRPDGLITAADRKVIGSPHPDFTAGLDLAVRRGAWEVSATIFGSFGNEIFDAQKYWYVFRYFDTNVRADRLANSVVLDANNVVTNPDAKYPRPDNSDVFSRQYSSYWVEDGSYVRLRMLQVAYNLPPALIRWIPAARVYLQAENLFTITGYDGLDPALPAPVSTGPAGDRRDQARGIDQGVYPSNRTITIGISTTF